MEWDQWIFARLWKTGRRIMAGKSPVPVADPGEALPSLECFARLVSGTMVELKATRGSGGVQGKKFLLPFHRPLFDSNEKNLDFFRLRILIMANMNTPEVQGRPEEIAANLLPGTLRIIFEQYPRSRQLYAKVRREIRRVEAQDIKLPPRRRRNLRDLLNGTIYSSFSPAGAHGGLQENQTDEQNIKSEIEVEIAGDSTVIEENKEKADEYTLAHSFEKIETLDDFDGHWRDLDNEEDVEEHSEAMNELKFRHRIRTDEQARSVVQADTSPSDVGDAAQHGSNENAFLYDEWDYRKQRYRRDHCRVFERKLTETRPNFAAEILETRRTAYREIERRLRGAYTELETVRRQVSGEDPDIDAVVQAIADLSGGRTPDERLYVSRRRRRQDIELLFLLDLSLSTDAWVAGRRALDIARESLLIFCEALNSHGIQFEIGGFFSRTRNDCEYVVIKDSKEEWLQARDRLGAAAPQGYTRIGPALRRGTERLEKSSCKRRWTILFTDGRPSDYDRYEGMYGIQDVRQALREAEVKGIHTHAFAVDARGKPAFREMLGEGSYEVINDPDQLPRALSAFFTRLIA